MLTVYMEGTQTHTYQLHPAPTQGCTPQVPCTSKYGHAPALKRQRPCNSLLCRQRKDVAPEFLTLAHTAHPSNASFYSLPFSTVKLADLPLLWDFFSSYREASHFYLDSVMEEHDSVFSTRIFSPTSTRQLTAKFQYNFKLSQTSKI